VETEFQLPTPEDRAEHFGDVRVWFTWGSAIFNRETHGAERIIPPAWFVRVGTQPSVPIASPGLTEDAFRDRLRELVGPDTAEAIIQRFSPRIGRTNLGDGLEPGRST
jgi:hypothetical protein